ncbi:MAG: cobaltochelatase CobT-related protein, partial [Roseimicrobium sp.]
QHLVVALQIIQIAMMKASPVILVLMRRLQFFAGKADTSDYRVFATDFDEVVNADQLPSLLPNLSSDQKHSFDEAIRQFETLFGGERVEIAASGAALVRELQAQFSAEERAQTVVSFLIDHSGSMRGLRMISALIAVEGAVDVLHDARIATEVLGFTTSSWKGGKSRKAWRWAGRPVNPGRLCDLRHIVYLAAERSARLSWHLRLALRPDLLHENIDGEALIWAAGRLRGEKWPRRIICLISDGAPIDDSTLLANADGQILVRHLESSERQLAGEGYVVATLMIGDENVREPDLLERAHEPLQAGVSLMRLLRRALLESQVPEHQDRNADDPSTINPPTSPSHPAPAA